MPEPREPNESRTWDRVFDEFVFADAEDDATTPENPFLDPPQHFSRPAEPPGPFSGPAHSTISKENIGAVLGEQQTRSIASDRDFLKQAENKRSFMRSRLKLGREGESTSVKEIMLGWNTRRKEEKKEAKEKKEGAMKIEARIKQAILREQLCKLEEEIERDEGKEEEEAEARLEALKRAGSNVNKPWLPPRPLASDDTLRGSNVDNKYADDITTDDPYRGHFRNKEDYETYLVASHAWMGNAYSVADITKYWQGAGAKPRIHHPEKWVEDSFYRKLGWSPTNCSGGYSHIKTHHG